jgi:hypothetical protein
MGNLIVGIIIGIMACTVGFSGMARWADSGVHKVQEITRTVNKELR